MSEESPPEIDEAGTGNETVAAETQPESGARGMLRDAIEKVMKEIEHHEAEAKRHLQLAAQLRNDLRESIAFLRKQGEQREAPAVPGDAASGEPAGQGRKGKEKHGMPSRKRRRAKAARKSTLAHVATGTRI